MAQFHAKKPHNALKHAGYSTMGLLPGESPAEEETARRKIPDPISRFPMLEINEPEDEGVQAARKDAVQAGEKRARDELGEYYELTLHGYDTDALTEDLDVEERLDAAIDKCMKRLLMVRGVKSIQVAPPSQLGQLPNPRNIKRAAA
jgi:hypothetical protein